MEKVARKSRRPPARTPEQRENECISAAYDLVEQRLREGTATSQETTYFLKRGSLRERLEMDKLREENEKLRAQTDAIRSEKNSAEMFEQAMQAFGIYSGESNSYEGYSDEEV